MVRRTSTIRIRSTGNGTSIRATGSAAQALFNLITGAAHAVEDRMDQAPKAVVRHELECIVSDKDNTYAARIWVWPNMGDIGLKGVKATCTAGPVHAVRALLRKSSAPLDVDNEQISLEPAQPGDIRETTRYRVLVEELAQ